MCTYKARERNRNQRRQKAAVDGEHGYGHRFQPSVERGVDVRGISICSVDYIDDFKT